MDEETIFFDTYAFFEILEANPEYKRFESAKAVTTIFNLAELNFALKRDKKRAADETTLKYAELLTEVTAEDVINAMTLRMEKRALSIPDAIGYTVAKRLGIKFLTGDKEFKGMESVEFVK
ncbi:MAG: PIN domain-containing protein [Candidatus Diapherotrites archaeon]|uniref:PIN domain-containing protein n=1 Tax=Candidatus Iainarchaeum sp. TaxID=3101447 RepID=A0A8T3YJ96_9ARCH|nr:PIN domain-containing protein [Candidatus Diapherotrites archaeon]